MIAGKVESVSEHAAACMAMLTDQESFRQVCTRSGPGPAFRGRGWSVRQETMTLS